MPFRDRTVCLLVLAALLAWPGNSCHAEAGRGNDPAVRWRDRFRFVPPAAATAGVCTGTIGVLPCFQVIPRGAGKHLVRVSLPFAPATLPAGMGLLVRCGGTTVAADLRPLTYHPGQPRSVRRGMLTFPIAFSSPEPRLCVLKLTDPRATSRAAFVRAGAEWAIEFAGMTLRLGPAGVRLTSEQGPCWKARLVAPARRSKDPGVPEIVEAGDHYLWVRLLVYDPQWPRIIELQADDLGTVAIQEHVQRLGPGDATAPELGWVVDGPVFSPRAPHAFANGAPCTLKTADGAWAVSFPAAPGTRRGRVTVTAADTGSTIRYTRCRPEDRVPMQQASWRRASLVIGKRGHTRRNALLEPALDVAIAPAALDAIYGTGLPTDVTLWPVLGDLCRFTREAIKRSAAVGDDYGNITSFRESQAHGGVFGMNRLNHCPAIFAESWRSGDRQLRDAAALWCSNMYDLSIWWRETAEVGGTRYNNANATGRPDHHADRRFMWRSNSAVTFCTKGYDALLIAYEETGDPRMAAALRAQVEYAKRYVHADQGECRNIGDAADFLRLYRFTGIQAYRRQALRLFHELRGKLSTGDLFSQSGKPIVADGPFINDDQHGDKAPFAKPYIVGYALTGLPELLRLCPEERKLRDVVRAVADFMAGAQDPVGGWRYPHPASARVIISQGMEHAAQLARAAAVLEARGESIDNLLDAIERTLQARVRGYQRTGTILAGLAGWEDARGAIPPGKTIYDLYAKPTDRDRARDYTEGRVTVGGSSPEGLVYFGAVLRFYLAHRPAERLLTANSPLRAVLARTEDHRLRLVPRSKGSFLRIERPDDSRVGLTLWAPEWVTLPHLGYGTKELGGMDVGWRRDEQTGAAWYTLDREQATLTACFVPHVDYVECTYTSWPKRGVHPRGSLGVGPCTQMKDSVFTGDEADLMARLWFLADGQWTSIGSCAKGNPRNVLHIKGHESPEMSGAMAASGWQTIQSPRPDGPLIACTSVDGRWVAATAAEYSTSLCNNAAASHRCMHSQGSVPLRKDGPTTLRVQVYLLKGGLDTLRARYQADVKRWAATPAVPPAVEPRTDTYGLRRRVPAFSDARVRRMDFPLAWRHAAAARANPQTPTAGPETNRSDGARHLSARARTETGTTGGVLWQHNGPLPWRDQARRVYLAHLSTPPRRAPFAPRVLAVEDRGTYAARKLALNINGDCRIKAYLLVPKAAGPHPGIVALHDHGAHFSIGKEKVVRPFGEPEAVIKDARGWVEQCYEGKWIGDELAARGYVVLAIDVLFWGDRGRFEGVRYETQQALASNMYQLGYSWAGYNVWDDIRSAEFLQGLPEVDPDRIGCVGLSMGANRAWHLAAATDIIKVGAAICWMGDTPSLTTEGNNQTTGQSAFSMLHAGLRNELDYADVASLACPKPMLFFNGARDGLFPVPGVKAAYAALRRIWVDQGVAERLVCKIWDVPHVFNAAMQREAFDWLDRYLK